MYLMVDISPNDMGFPRAPQDYSNLRPFNRPAFYHSECTIRWGHLESEQHCWLEKLPDLRTEDDDVRALFRAWIADLVKTYGIDGLRIDAALEIEPEFWTEGGFREAAGVFLLAEVDRNGTDFLASYQPYLDGIIDYATWERFIPAFRSTRGSLAHLAAVTDEFAAKADVNMAVWGSFAENQDQPRFPSLNPDVALDKNVIALTMLRDAIPITYYGQEQFYAGGERPLNREALWLGQGYNQGAGSPLYGWIQHLNAVRRTAADADAGFLANRTKTLFFRDPDRAAEGTAGVIGFRKGQMVTLFTNGGVAAGNKVAYALSRGLTGYDRNAAVVDVLNCELFQVARSGFLHVQMPDGGLPRAFLPQSQAAALCPTTRAPVADAPSIVYVKKAGD